ncbi:MAG: hypothetical protein D6732_18825, partial [Methanobacteriota archaeon]
DITPEERLVVAVVKQAIVDYYGRDRVNARDARRWFGSGDVSPFSYRWCCSVLGVSERRLRALLLKPGWKAHFHEAIRVLIAKKRK